MPLRMVEINPLMPVAAGEGGNIPSLPCAVTQKPGRSSRAWEELLLDHPNQCPSILSLRMEICPPPSEVFIPWPRSSDSKEVSPEIQSKPPLLWQELVAAFPQALTAAGGAA